MTTTSTTTPHSELYDAGLAMRKTVLGDAYVDKALSAVTEFGQPMQDLVTEYCWGGIWTREGLDRRTRSLLNLVMLTALNRQIESRRTCAAHGPTGSPTKRSRKHSCRPPYTSVYQLPWRPSATRSGYFANSTLRNKPTETRAG